MSRNHGHQPAHIGPPDPNNPDQFGFSIGGEQIDLCLASTDGVDLGRLVVRGVDDEPAAMRVADHNRGWS